MTDVMREVMLHMKAPPTPKVALAEFMTLAPDFAALYGCEAWRMYDIRSKLNTLHNRLKRDGYGVQAAIVASAIYVLKRIAETPDTEPYFDGHALSDHAFCAAMRRLGYDLYRYKDMALEEAREAGLVPVQDGRTVITFLPAKGGDA
jgi:hypothetical protein